MNKRPTIRDVARRAGVSTTVVSRVLNPGSGPVAPDTRARVVEVMDTLAYRPQAAAKELSAGRADTLGLMLADLANPFFARLADRIVWEARSRGVQVALMTTQEDHQLEAEALEALRDRSVGAVIATPTGRNADGWRHLMDIGIHVVFVDRFNEALPEPDVVSIENTQSARVATEHLVELGHSRIGFISGPTATSTGRDRTTGYQETLAVHGIPFDRELVHAVPFRGEAGGDAVGGLLALRDRPTALIIANTAQVQNSLRRLVQASIDIPGELSVIVFDDSPWTELMAPPLTVVRQPINMLAVHSLELSLGRLRGTLPRSTRRITVEAEFVRRGSTAACAGPGGPDLR
jgi:LacI family transcriptional regulator, galactose operon repressor